MKWASFDAWWDVNGIAGRGLFEIAREAWRESRASAEAPTVAHPVQEPCQHKRQKWAINMRTGSCSDCGATFVFGADGNPDSWSPPAALAAAETPTVAQPAQEPVHVEAVATVQAGEDGLYLDWLIEGGICALEEGCTLVMPSRPITDDFGSGEVYAAPPQPVPLTDEQIGQLRADYQAGTIGTFVELCRTVERAHGIGSKA